MDNKQHEAVKEFTHALIVELTDHVQDFRSLADCTQGRGMMARSYCRSAAEWQQVIDVIRKKLDALHAPTPENLPPVAIQEPVCGLCGGVTSEHTCVDCGRGPLCMDCRFGHLGHVCAKPESGGGNGGQ